MAKSKTDIKIKRKANKIAKERAELSNLEYRLSQNEEFANYLKLKKNLDKEEEKFRDLAKQEMLKNNLYQIETDNLKLTLSKANTFKIDNEEDIDEKFLVTKKTLNTVEVKKMYELERRIPKGVKHVITPSLRITIKES